MKLRATIEQEGDGYVSLCPELDIASQGETAQEARSNLIEALELFFETADTSEIERRLNNEVFVERVEVKVGVDKVFSKGYNNWIQVNFDNQIDF